MGYTIEISLDLMKQQNISSFKDILVEKANKYNCNNIYWFHEVENTAKNKYKNNMIGCFSFDYDTIDKANCFINYIKTVHSVHLECIYEDNIYKLLYVSSYYLKKMNKEYAKLYKSNNQTKKYTPNEEVLLKNFIKLPANTNTKC